MASNEKRVRMAVIAGAVHAMKYKNKNWKATEDEVVKHVTDNTDEILEKIDDPL